MSTFKSHLAVAAFAFLTGAFLAYHSHPKLTLFCPGEQIGELVEADAPLSQLDGWVEFKKYEHNGLFRSWSEEPYNAQRSNCSAFMYK